MGEEVRLPTERLGLLTVSYGDSQVAFAALFVCGGVVAEVVGEFNVFYFISAEFCFNSISYYY